ncbi:MAG TPA: hypothetical protein VJ440_08545 [Candidatus Brocadiaceae bacterium]|nr:hypothetical protein [Candidatus Brocadiaceae bacterium]
MKKSFILLFLFVPLFTYPAAFAVETAPRISDREIIEGLSTIRGDVKELRAEIKRLDEGQKATANELRASITSSVNELRSEIKRLEEGQKASANELRATISSSANELRTEIKRLDEGQKALEKRFGERFDVLQWMLGLFITVAISLMGIMGRILWTQQKRLTQIETTLEAQKEEISFIKALIVKLQSLIESLLPPRSVL